MQSQLLPANWQLTDLGDISSDISYGYTASATSEPTGVKLLRITDIQNNTVNWPNVPNCKIEPEKVGKYRLKPSDLVFARTGATVGKSYLLKGEIPDSVYASYLIRVRCLEGVSIEFLANYFQSPYYWRQITDFSAGIGQPNVNGTKLKNLSVPVPPLAEQKVIADKLDTLLAQVENTKARLERIPQILKRFRQSVLAAAMSGRLTEEWRRYSGLPNPTNGKLSDCIESMVGGASPKTSDYSENGVLALNKGDIKEYGRIEDKRNPKYVPLAFVESNSKKVIPNGTIVVTLRDLSQKADFLGLIGRYQGQDPALITQGMYGLKLDPNVAIEDYLIAFSNAPQYRSQVKKEKVGATQVHLRNGQFLELAIPLFAVEEQTEIVRRVDQLFAHADRIEQQVNNALARVNNLTQSILAKAFRGELTEQWRKDNPELISGENNAEALLERIKAQRAAVKPAKGSRRKANA
ncbi:restriction endonuclease subunit S [Marinobacter koreensis]|uniref:Restriction endonuclease subunit S n=1 Tax=Marinobacter koreensis TaxID=335974 RepID=A0ABW0RQG6_9GAMM|nr:restriction endonuclease subunit S [Marinobacter koreensis]MCK7547993.1 restriction endonuclease subunit S [Marinobacter koreensis]